MPIVSKETELPNCVNFIGTLRLIVRGRAEDVSGRECCAKLMASCCCLRTELRLRYFQGQLHRVTVLADLTVFHQLLMVTYSPLYSVCTTE